METPFRTLRSPGKSLPPWAQSTKTEFWRHRDLKGNTRRAVEAEFERLGKSGTGNASVNMGIGPLASVEVVNDGFEISVGRSVQLEAVAEDVYGNVIDDANFEWQAVRREDRITGEGVFTAGTAVSNGTRELVRLVASHEGVGTEH